MFDWKHDWHHRMATNKNPGDEKCMISALEIVLKEIGSNILMGSLTGDGTDESAKRNGLVMAHNIIVNKIYEIKRGLKPYISE